MMRADNEGEGGILALLALAQRRLNQIGTCGRGSPSTWRSIGTALFFCDALITPAISVLSAVEGLELLDPTFSRAVIPVTLGVIVALFWIQRSGTARVGGAVRPDHGGVVPGDWPCPAPPPSSRAPRGAGGASIRTYAVKRAVQQSRDGAGAHRRRVPGGDRRRGAVCGHGPLRQAAGARGLVRAGRGRRWCSTTSGRARCCLGSAAAPTMPLYRAWCRRPRAALDGGAGHRRHRDRLAGGDLRGLLRGAPGHPARSAAAHARPADLGPRAGPDLRADRQLADAVRAVVACSCWASAPRTPWAAHTARRSWAPCSSPPFSGAFVAATQWGWPPLAVGGLFGRHAVRRLGVRRRQHDQDPGRRLGAADAGAILCRHLYDLAHRPRRAARGAGRAGRSRARSCRSCWRVPTACRAPECFSPATPAYIPSALIRNIEHNKVVHERVIILNFQIVDTPRQDPADRAAHPGGGAGRLLPSPRASASWRPRTCRGAQGLPLTRTARVTGGQLVLHRPARGRRPAAARAGRA